MKERLPIVAIVLATVYGIWRRSVDLDPRSLWLDDAWVAVLARDGAMADWGRFGGATPPLFLVVTRVLIGLIPDPEVAVQLVPFLAGVAAIPLAGAVTWRIAGCPLAAVVGAWLVAADPLAIVYSARVKPYTLDMVVVLGHLAALASPPRRVLGYAAAVAASLWLSTLSVFVAAVFVPATLLRIDGWRPRALSGGVVLASAVALYALVLRPGVNDSLRTFWGGQYLDSPAGAAATLGAWVGQTTHSRSVVGLIVALGIVVAGFVRLWRRSRVHVLAIAGVALLVLGASAAGRFPVGVGRIELFLVPLVALVTAAGFAWVRPQAVGVVTLVLVALWSHEPRERAYPRQEVATLARLVPRDAPVLANVHAAFGLAYYGSSEALVADATLGTGFHASPTDVTVLREGHLEEDLAPVLARRPPHLSVVLCNEAAFRDRVRDALAREGWIVVGVMVRPGAIAFIAGRTRE